MGTQAFEDLMVAVDSEPVPGEVVDPSAVDTLPADLPGDFNLAMPSPSRRHLPCQLWMPEFWSYSTLDAT